MDPAAPTKNRAVAPGRFRFGIAFKITLFLIFFVVVICVTGYVSYDDLVMTEKKMGVLETSYRIHDNILESRRLEKNYFLYGNTDFLHENLRVIEAAMQTCGKLNVGDKGLRVGVKLRELEGQLGDYHAKIARLVHATEQPQSAVAETDIRHSGKLISDLGEQVVLFEKNRIHLLISQLKQQLILWSSFAILVGVMLSFAIVRLVFKPLAAIKQAAQSIAGGDFVKINVIRTRDEIQQVMEAFNIMVTELELRQDQLVQAEKLSSLGTLTAGVAHQMNNPLNNISTSCQIAIDEFDAGRPELQRRMLHNIEQETLRVRDVVKSLLEFARTQEFALRPAFLVEVVHKSILLAKSQIRPDTRLIVDIAPELSIPMDVQRMQEVFINLIINATQAIEREGRITITASLEEATGEALIEVRDNGPGIPEKHQAKIFDPFFTTKDVGEGTGLGLSVVYGIVQQHHGRITVQSAAGQGTAFFIRLPISATG